MKKFLHNPLLYVNLVLFAIAIMIIAIPQAKASFLTFVQTVWAEVDKITGEGNAGNIAVFAAGSDPTNTIGNSVIYQDSNNRIGIGINNPNKRLDVNGAIHATNDICTDVGGGTCLGDLSGSAFWDVSGNNIYNANSGSVGIGTAIPSTKLHIQGSQISSFTGTTAGILRIDAPYESTYYEAIDFGHDIGSPPTARIAAYHDGDGSKLSFGTSETYSQGITNIGMTIDRDGNVGIGTAKPNLKLEVWGGDGLPAWSGTVQNGALRLRRGGVNVIDFGLDSVNPGAGWMQVTDWNDLSQTRPLLLNPHGGEVAIGNVAGPLWAALSVNGPVSANDIYSPVLGKYMSDFCYYNGSNWVNCPPPGGGAMPNLQTVTNEGSNTDKKITASDFCLPGVGSTCLSTIPNVFFHNAFNNGCNNVTCTAMCPYSTDHAVGGGYDSYWGEDINYNGPVDDRTWRVVDASWKGGQGHDLWTVYVICADSRY